MHDRQAEHRVAQTELAARIRDCAALTAQLQRIRQDQKDSLQTVQELQDRLAAAEAGKNAGHTAATQTARLTRIVQETQSVADTAQARNNDLTQELE
jgi:TolA-binding protein